MRQELEKTLEQLHAHLEDITDLNDNEVQALRKSVQEIQATLDQTDVNSASLAKMLQESVDKFSETHPVVTQTVGRIADILAQMGI